MSLLAPHLPALQVVVPLLGALLTGLMRRGRAAFLLTLAVSWLMPIIAAQLLWQVLETGPISYRMGGWPPPWGIEYRVDALNGFVLLLVSGIAAVIVPFAYRSVALEIEESNRAWFYTMYLLCLTGLLGITITGDAFNVFVFMEISSLSSYVLIAMGRDRRALLAAYQYLIMGTVGATFYVIGVGFLYLVTGTLNIADMAQRLGPAVAAHGPAVLTGLAFLVVGVSLKLAMFPLHAWLPNAYAYAPSFATVFLAATATKVAVYLLIRLYFSVFGVAIDMTTLPVGPIIIGLSLAAMLVASLIAVYQGDLKRMLAYSSVAQIGYMTLGIGLANQAGLTGGLVHLLNHAIMKATLFLALGAIVFRVGTVQLADLGGIAKKMPVTMTAFTVAGFAMIGAPGTVGFISKWYLVIGALEGAGWWLAILVVASSLVSLVYVGRVLEAAWLREPGPAIAHATDPPLTMLAPILLLAAATIYLGLDTRLTAGIASVAAEGLLGMPK